MRVDPLFSLVESMTAPEKRYFRIQVGGAAGGNSSVSLRLFDAINSMVDCSDARLLAHFSGQPLTANLSAAKQKLRKLILKHLRAFHAEKSIHSELRMRTEEIELLLQRRLDKQALKLINSTLRKARQLELHSHTLELLDLKHRLSTENLPPKAQKEVLAVHQGKSDLLDQLHQETALNGLYRKSVLLYKQHKGLKGESLEEQIVEIEEDPLLREACKTQRGRIYQLNILASNRFLQRDWDSIMKLGLTTYEIYAKVPGLSHTDPELYLSSMLHLLNGCLYQGEQTAFLSYLDELKGVIPGLPGNSFRQQRRIHYLELFYCLNFSNETRGKELLRTLPKWIEENKAELSAATILNFQFNFAVFYFLHAGYSSALPFVNAILDHAGSDYRRDIHRCAQQLELIIHYELGHFDLLEYRLRTYHKAIGKSPLNPPFERFVYQCFYDLLRDKDQEGRKSTLQLVLGKLEELPSLKGWELPMGYQEMTFWVQGRSTDRSIRDVYRGALKEDGRLLE